MDDQQWIEFETKLQNRFSSLKVNYEPSTTVTVTVLRGRKISVGFFHDFFDVPDTQVYVKCGAALGLKNFKTKIARNTRDPEWNEAFTFVLPDDAENTKIEIDVYEEDRFKYDPHQGAGCYEAQELEFDKPKLVTLDMKRRGQIDLELLKRRRATPDCRMSLGLSKEEKQYRLKRKPKTMTALQQVLGEDKGPRSLEETPTIAVAITGGGYRAVATSCGAMEALAEANLVDTLMYIAGLSGSSWYISTSYLHQSMANLTSLICHHDWLRRRMEKSLTGCLFDISFYKRYREYRDFKKQHNQVTTFVDFYGLAIGEAFLGEEGTKATLSSLWSYVENAEVPFPILSCAHVHEYLPMSIYWGFNVVSLESGIKHGDILDSLRGPHTTYISKQNEVEMTPIEVSLPSYGINMPTEKFNSRWGNGILQQDLPEPLLHYLMGASGSAFAILWSKMSDKNEIEDDLQEYINATHHSQREGENPDPVDDDSDDEEDEVDSRPVSLRQKSTENFASRHDDWIEELEKKAANETPNAQEGGLGRGFLLERTAKVRSCAMSYKNMQKFLFNTEKIDPTREGVSERFRKKISTKKKNMSLCDSALGCNLPAIHVVRPHRTVDVLIVVDCSNYYSENSLMMELFATVQSEIYDHGIKFPRISIEKLSDDPFQEFYLFEDPEDPECPIVLWFTLANDKFKNLENPPRRSGYPTPDAADSGEEKFNDFCIFPESSDFGTLRLSFTPLNFDRIRELMKFNISTNMEIVKEKIANKVKQLGGGT